MSAPGDRSGPQLVLLDRDGVLNIDRADFVKSPDELILIPGAAAAVARLNRAGIKAVVVSNQSAVGRGIIDEAMLARIHEMLAAELAATGAALDAVIVCTDAPEKATERRKPGAGMLRDAIEKFRADPAQTVVIGDALRDLEAAAKIGCRRILVRTGKGAATERAGIPAHLRPVAVYDDLARAVEALLGEAERPPAARSAQPRERLSFAARLALAWMIVLALWAAGFAWFGASLPDHVADTTTHTDAIVVLTGGTERVSTGIDLLAAGLGKRLLVSGVHRDVGVAELLRQSPDAPASLACCIDLGYAAGDTVGNAEEAAEWMRAQGFRSLRLVTANYHLPRSLLEFHSAMPDVEIVEHPVFPASMPGTGWWRRPASVSLVALEYCKYLVALLRHVIAPAANP